MGKNTPQEVKWTSNIPKSPQKRNRWIRQPRKATPCEQVFSITYIPMILEFLDPTTAIATQRISRLWKICVQSSRFIGFRSLSSARAIIVEYEQDVKSVENFDIHPSLSSISGCFELVKQPCLWPTVMYTPMLQDLLVFRVDPAFALGTLDHNNLNSTASWRRLQITTPIVQRLELWNTYMCFQTPRGGDAEVLDHQLWNNNYLRIRSIRRIFPALFIENIEGIRMGQVAEHMQQSVEWHLPLEDRLPRHLPTTINFVWKIHALPTSAANAV